MRHLEATTVLALILLLAGPAAALPISDATYTEQIQLSFEGMTVGTFFGADNATAETFTHTDSGPGTSFTGTAETSVTDLNPGSNLPPVSRVESSATFTNLVLVDGGEGFASARTQIVFEFTLIPTGGNPLTPIDVDFITTGFASVMSDTDGTDLFASGTLRTEVRRSGSVIASDSATVRADCPTGVSCATPIIDNLALTTLTMTFVPATDIGRIIQESLGFVVPGAPTHKITGSGEYNVWIDPIIQITPGQLVDVGGELVPAEQAFSFETSSNFVPMPGPAPVLLLLVGLAGIAIRARR